MKRLFFIAGAFVLAVFYTIPATVHAQGRIAGGPDPSTLRDVDLEKDSLHNLQVARHYFKSKKAYRAAVARCEEVIAGNPTFSRLDEVLYIAGVSSLRLSENRGKQAPTAPPEQLREEAREYLSRLVNEYPDSSFRERAENELRTVGGVKPKTGEEKKQ